ncbi:TolC family outer membrane protein [Teredinibacter purpureus]|uniref:TolC family outer membrane protein n=1 Tax=Teredinibacter purpureus TaxID=2731756 RepID=UPI0013C4F739|nr:TolC family outer membrane protein [Teredinibacter purpureus]
MKICIVIAMALLSSMSVTAENLKDIYSLALENDYRYKVAESNYLALSESRALGRSRLLPSLVVEGSLVNSETENERLSSNPFAAPSETTSGTISQRYSVVLSQPIIDFSAVYGYQKGKGTAKRAALQWQQAKHALIVRATSAYLKTLKTNADYTAARSAEAAYKAQLTSVQLAYDTGLVSSSDLLQVKSAYDSATAERIVAENSVRVQFYELMRITGSDHDALAGFAENFTVEKPKPAVLNDWVDMAKAQNLELHIAKIFEREYKNNYKEKASAHLPTLTGRLGYSYNDDANSFSNDSPYDMTTSDISASVTLTIPVFSGGGTSASTRQARYQYYEQRDNRNLVERDVIQETRANYLNTLAGVANVNARKVALESSLSALNSAQAGYKEGVLSVVDLLEVQRTHYTAWRLYTTAIHDYLIAGLQLKNVAGTLSGDDIEYIDRYLSDDNAVTKPS